jgi:threonine/homoserine/homoserine lactone efflux protein
MLGTQNLWLFVVAGVLLNLTPGQDTFYILGRSIAQGRRAGVLSVLGITSGSLVHTLAAAFGLSAILATSAEAFLIVKMAGAAYLIYLGLRMILDRSSDAGRPAEYRHESDWAVYRAGFFSNLLNPKVALFFIAFLPQFVAPSADFKILAFLFLGALFMTTGTLWCLALAWFGAAMSRRLRENPAAGSRLRRASGAVFVGLGLKLAISR